MELTEEEKAMIEGKFGYPARKSMELLITLGEIYGAKKMARTSSVHVVGGSIITDGKAGALYVEEIVNKGGKFITDVTVSPSALDSFYWKEMGVSDSDFGKAREKSE